MKRKLALFAIVLAVLMLVPAFALAAESDETGPLDKIDAYTPPTKKTYKVGETYDPSGIAIDVLYKSGATYYTIPYSTSNGFATSMDGHDIDGYVFTKNDIGTKKITIRYTKNNSTVTKDITGAFEVVDSLELKLLEAGNDPTKQCYYIGETFDKSGMTAKATYDLTGIDYTKSGYTASAKKTTKEVSAANLSVESHTFTADEAGKEVKLTVSYTDGGITKSYEIPAYVYELTDFYVTKQPKKQVYYANESFDKTGTEFEAVYTATADPNTKTETKKIDIKNVFIEGRTYSNDDVNSTTKTVFEVTATFTYGNTALNAGAGTKKNPINTYVYKLTDVKITTDPYKTEYLVGEAFNPAGMVVTGTFTGTDSTPTVVKKILSGYTYNRAAFTSEDAKSSPVDRPIYYTYAGKTIEAKTGTTPATLTVQVKKIDGKYIYLDKASLFMTAGETKKINATVLPEDATDPLADIDWDTVDKTVATVDDYGVVTAIGEGRTFVTAKIGTQEARCYVNVEPNTPITSIKFNKTSLDLLLGDSTKLEPVIVPTDATVTKTWLSTAPKVVSVSDDGTIKGLKEGSAVITVTADGLQAKMNITVSKTLNTTGTVVNCQRRINVRAKASGSSSSIGYAYLGQTYKILGEQDNWYKIQFTSSKVGYIWKKYLSSNGGKDYTPVTEPTTTTTVTTEGVSVTATDSSVTITAGTTSATTATKVTIVNCSRYIYIRKGPSTATSKIGHAVPGTVFTLTGASGDWYAIDYNGQVGYVFKDFCKLG